MSVFPRVAWADPYDAPRTNAVTTHTRASNHAVTIDRRVTSTGYVEVTRQF